LAATISSPACLMFRIVVAVAAEPEATASAPLPPSSAAIQFSRTSLVGSMMRA
jgi:hypothetical protein